MLPIIQTLSLTGNCKHLLLKIPVIARFSNFNRHLVRCVFVSAQTAAAQASTLITYRGLSWRIAENGFPGGDVQFRYPPSIIN